MSETEYGVSPIPTCSSPQAYCPRSRQPVRRDKIRNPANALLPAGFGMTIGWA